MIDRSNTRLRFTPAAIKRRRSCGSSPGGYEHGIAHPLAGYRTSSGSRDCSSAIFPASRLNRHPHRIQASQPNAGAEGAYFRPADWVFADWTGNGQSRLRGQAAQSGLRARHTARP